MFSLYSTVKLTCFDVSVYGLRWVGSVIWWVWLGWVEENRPMDNSAIAYY